jgi:hypothetical protein
MGLAGLVSKYRDSFYRAAGVIAGSKSKTAAHAAFSRVMDAF